MNRNFAAAAAAVLALFTGHAVAAEKQWVQGSWVNLRAAAAANGAIVDRLIVNTEVSLLLKQGDWCEVTAKTPEVRGFVTCSMLGTQAVSLAEVGSPMLADKPNPRYSAPRAFWLAPSMVRLQVAGDHFWNAMLTEAQRAKEHPQQFDDKGNPVPDADKRPPPVRYAIPEFEAMKDLLKRGVVAAPERRPVLVRWAELQQAVANSVNESIQLPGGRWVPDAVGPMVRNARLNAARPSFFQREADLAPAASGIEELSAQFGIVERLKVLGGPKWVHPRHNDPYVAGNWDIGSFEITLDKPVLEYAVGRKGLAGLREWAASWRVDVTQEESCSEGMNLTPRAVRSLPDYPQVKDPLVWLHVAKPVPFKKVRVTTAARKLPPAPKEQEQRNGYTTLFMHDVDIDGDGVPDIAVWEGMQRDGKGGDTLGVRVVFANIAGEWFLVDADYLVECS